MLLIIRHSHRVKMPVELGNKTPRNFDEDQVPLTEYGIKKSIEYGETAHKTGKHEDSVKMLEEALKKLG